MYLPQRLGLSRQRCSYCTLPLTSFTCRGDDHPHNPNAEFYHAEDSHHHRSPNTDTRPSRVSGDGMACTRRVFRCLCMATWYVVEGWGLCYVNPVLRTLRCRNTPSYADPVLVLLLSWTADVDNLTQLGCEHVSRFRRACHISFSIASSSIHVCMIGLLTLGIVVYHTDVLIFTQRLPFF